MKIKKVSSTGTIPVWQTGKSPITAQGGFTLDRTGLTVGDVIPAGSPMNYDESTRKAKLVKTAKLQASATNSATAYKVFKGHLIKVGDYIASAVGGAAYAVTAIDSSNSDYDELTVGTTLGVVLAAGAPIFVSTATGATAAANSANGLLYEDEVVEENCTVSVVVAGMVYARRIPSIPSTILSTLPKTIIFSQSF